MKIKEQLGAIGAIKKMKPVISISSDIIPELKDWKVGGKYRVELDLEQVGMQNMDEAGFTWPQDEEDEESEESEEGEERGNQFKGEFIIKKAKVL